MLFLNQNYNNIIKKSIKTLILKYMVRFPNAKINLGLRVLRKRNDGYHDIETILYPVEIYDALELIRTPDRPFTFSASGLDIPGSADSNLCTRAFALMQAEYSIPNVSIHLHKCIPMGAGLGGGSSDAAYVLMMIDEMFGLNLDVAVLQDLASRLGSDCPFFIHGQAAIAHGRGEILKALDLSLEDFYFLIVKPDNHINTAEAYSNIHAASHDIPLDELTQKPITEWHKWIFNDFESYVFMKYPGLDEIKSRMYQQGALYASLTGSGSALYGIFDHAPAIEGLDDNYYTWSGSFR